MAIIGPCRVSYLNCWEPRETPSGDLKYSVSVLIKDSDKANIKKVNDAIQKAIEVALSKNVFPKAAVPNLRLPLRNGSEEFEMGNRGEEYNGHKFLNATSKNAPGIVGPDNQPLMDQNEIYSGCYCYVDLAFFGYNQAGNRGIGVGFNNIMKYKDGDRLDGRQSAESAFKDIKPENVEEGDDLT